MSNSNSDGSKPEQAEEKDLTPEERLQWLRDRGVLIETPEERRAGQVASAMQEADALQQQQQQQGSTTKKITYVYIPADKAKPLQDCFFVPPKPKSSSSSSSFMGGDPLSEHLKSAFATDSDKIDISLFQQTSPLHQLGSTSSATTTTTPTVSTETLQKVAKQGHVETFALVHPTLSNNYTGVHLYLDEVGQMKRLPLNARAGEYAQAAGYNPPPIFYGDVFVARIRKRGPVLESYLDLTAPECHIQAPWLQRAAMDNLEYQMEFNRLTGRQGETQPAVAGSDGVAKTEEGYSWTQTEDELELVVPARCDDADAVVTAKDISVVFKPNKVQVKNKKHSREPLLVSIDLFERIDCDGCTWTIEKGKNNEVKVVLTMEKVEQALWPRIEN